MRPARHFEFETPDLIALFSFLVFWRKSGHRSGPLLLLRGHPAGISRPVDCNAAHKDRHRAYGKKSGGSVASCSGVDFINILGAALLYEVVLEALLHLQFDFVLRIALKLLGNIDEMWPQVSIPSTFYEQIFLHECHFSSYILALSKKLFKKFTHSMLMKLTTGINFCIVLWANFAPVYFHWSYKGTLKRGSVGWQMNAHFSCF